MIHSITITRLGAMIRSATMLRFGQWLEAHVRISAALVPAALLWMSAAACAATCAGPAPLEAKLQHSPNLETHTQLGDWFTKHQQYGCAADAFAAALKLQPGSARLNYLYGQSLYNSGSAEAALVPLRQAVQLAPNAVEDRLALAAALDRTQNPHDAELQWKAALDADPHSTAAVHGAALHSLALNGLTKDMLAEKNPGWIIALLGATPTQLNPELTVILARAYGDSGRLEDASKLLRPAAQANPSSVPLANALAGVLVMQSRKQEAEDLLQATMKQHPGDTAVELLYLRLLVINDDTVKARPLATSLLAADANNWEVQYLNGVLDRRASDYAAARDHLELAVALNPKSIEVRQNLGAVLAKLKSPSLAREQFETAIALGSQDPEIRFELAGVLRTLGETQEYAKQINIYHQEIQAQSDLTQAAAKAAFADQRLAAGDVAQALQLYREACALAPREPSLLYKLAMALDKAGDPAGEKAALEQTIQINPAMAQAQNQLGYLASRDGDIPSAEQHFRLAVAASPEFAKAWINLSATLYLESRLPEAKDAVQHALQLEPGNPQAQALINRLNSM